MTAEEMRPMWNWAVDYISIWDLIHELWPEERAFRPNNGPLSRMFLAESNRAGGGNASAFEHLLIHMPPDQRLKLHNAILAKRLTS